MRAPSPDGTGVPSLLDHPQAQEFLREFQEVHLAELEFLLLQRHRLLDAPGTPWPAVARWEQRIQGHLEAMRAGGTLALNLAREALVSGDGGQFLAGVFVLGSIDPETIGIEALPEARLQALEEVLPSWVQALALVEHPALAAQCTRALKNGHPQVRASAAHLLGYRREGRPADLVALLDDVSPEVRNTAALALARHGYRPALPRIEQVLALQPVTAMELLLLGALMLGSHKALTHCREVCRTRENVPSGLPRLLALAGTEQDANLLIRLGENPQLEDSVPEALGILGDPRCIPLLLRALTSHKPGIRHAAAAALQLITGAGLVQLSPERQEEDADEESSHERLHRRPSTDAHAWGQWWGAHRHEFQGARRYRHGRPFHLGECIHTMSVPETPSTLRAQAWTELVIRSGQYIGFEPTWPHPRQNRALEAWRQWWSGRTSR